MAAPLVLTCCHNRPHTMLPHVLSLHQCDPALPSHPRVREERFQTILAKTSQPTQTTPASGKLTITWAVRSEVQRRTS
jgi:hypothetical protein